ncbi:unnamed protein product [Hymenolepis diminuta]|uniref:Uncharacterized protein n=1 Tax=Hymenolepis diminuta TaxID=6216 RepID=A0A564Z3E3_HYMDI|nr:unnamed protein product [Hymenolepis diminuta]
MECFGDCEKFWKIFAIFMLIVGICCVIAGSIMVAQNKQNVYHFTATSHQAKMWIGGITLIIFGLIVAISSTLCGCCAFQCSILDSCC